MKPGTEGLASPDSNMVAPQDKDRENDWIQVQSKKNRRLAKKKSSSQTKFKPSCKHHASPDSLINIDTSSDDDSASYADVLMGKKKPTKPVCKRTLNLSPKKRKDDTVVLKNNEKDSSSVSSIESSNSDEERTDIKEKDNTTETQLETALAARNPEASYNKMSYNKLITKHPSLNAPTYIQDHDQIKLQLVYQQNEISHQIEENKQHIKEMLQPLICNDTRLISIKSTANDCSHIKNDHNHKIQIQQELPRLFDRIFPISTRILAHKHKKITRSKSTDWQRYGIERMTELLWYKHSMFGYQLMKNGYLHSFRELYEELDSYYDTWVILYKNIKTLFLNKIEQISLFIFDILPENYMEQGMWPNNPPQGSWATFLSKIDIIHEARNKWLQLIGEDYQLFL